MSMRDVATADNQRLLTDDVTGFGWPVTVTDPAGLTAHLVGFTTDIGVTLEPDTGSMVAGRRASVALRMSDLRDAGFASLPVHVPDPAGKPWVIEFLHSDKSEAGVYTVSDTMPDRTFGLVVCILEAYEVAPPVSVP